MTVPLEGIKVLDFSHTLGSMATWLLADFGAEVIHVEEPPQREGRRAEWAAGTVNPPRMDRGSPYNHMGRNKKSIVLNLNRPRAQAVAQELAKRSDVLLEDYRPGVLAEMGMGYPTVSALNPRLVYCSITLYGQNGPYKDHPGHDPCAMAVTGIHSMHSDAEGKPRMLTLPFDDYTSAFHAIIGILMALRARDITSQGQHVDISMADAALDFMGGVASSVFQGRRPMRLDTPNPSTGVWQCKDGKWLCTTNVEAHHWANFCRTIGHEDWIPHQYNRERRNEMYQVVKETFLTKTREEWLTLLWGEMESQASPVNSYEEVWQDPQILARNMVLELENPKVGKVKQLGYSIKLEKTPARFRSFTATPGQHTQELLASLGYSNSQIEELKRQGAVA